MPDAFENFTAYTRVQSITPLTPVQQPSGSYFTSNYDLHTMSTAGSFSPSSMESPLMEGCDNLSTAQVFDIIGNPISQNSYEKVEIKILVQPVDKFRFRYKSEMMGTHGSLLGEREDSSHKKEVPTVQLINCPVRNAVIRCSLVTAEEDRRFAHAHHLVRKDGNEDKDDPHDIEVSSDNNYIAMFCNMGIIHTAKKNIKEEILRKRRIEVEEEKKRVNFNNPTITTREDLEMKLEAEKAQKWMNLNSVALCFQGFCYGENNVLHPLTDKIYSRPINNLKSALTGELKICRIDKHTSSCEGNEEVWLLVEKVGKKNIKVKFYEVDDKDNQIWDADGRFSELDVHHQYAIVFKTPPYKDLSITKPVEVLVKLERPSDGEVSNSIKFVYKPSDKVLNRKRPRMSSSGSMEFAQITTTTAQAPPLELCMPMAETFMNLGEDNISNLSGEIKKLLSDGQNCNSKDLEAFLNDHSSLEKYFSLSNLSDGLVADGAGPTEFEKNQQDFANECLRKAMNILKDTESTGGSKYEMIRKIQELLEESTSFGDTPLHFSLRHEQFETAKYLLLILGSDPSFKTIVNMQNSARKTPLHLAVLQNQVDIVRALLRLGADPNLGDEDDATSLHNAVMVNANACIDELLKSNIKLNLEAHTEVGWSALHLAAKAGSLYAVQALVEAGVNINSTDMSYGRTALHIAVDSNHKHIVEYLLTKTKIDVNMKNFGGNTALHSAVVKGGKCAEELITILTKYGADPKIRNNNINRDDEEEDSNSMPMQAPLDNSTTPTIKSESGDSDDDVPRPGESSFDLARDDPKLMQLLSEERPSDPIQEELDLKEESEDEMMLQDRAILQASRASNQNRISNAQERPPMQTMGKTMTATSLLTGPQIQAARPGEEKLTDAHVARILPILDRTGGWERLAQHTNHGSLVRLYKKMKSPSKALFVKIRLQNPDITVSQVKKLLIQVQAFEAASALH